MKRIFILTVFLAAYGMASAQGGKVNSAINYVNSGQLDKAKEAIEAAEVHEKTKNAPKMYYAKGKVLQAVGESDVEEYKNLYEDPLFQAYDYYMKAIEMDDKDRFGKMVDLSLPMLSNDFINLGISKFQESDFASALKAFETTLKISERPFYGGIIDTTIMFNAGLAAYNGKLYDDAIKHFSSVKDLDYGDFTLFILMKNSYVEKGDSAGGLQILQEGFTKYPESESLLIELINYYITMGGIDAAQEALDYIGLAKEQDPTNASYYHAEGLLYDKIGKIEESIKSYEEALVRNPDYFESNYNLGAHHFNRGVNKVNECNEIMDNTEYQKCKVEADAMFEMALPYMEKAHAADSTDISTLETLKLLYYRMKMMDKHDEIDAKLKEVKDGL